MALIFYGLTFYIFNFRKELWAKPRGCWAKEISSITNDDWRWAETETVIRA